MSNGGDITTYVLTALISGTFSLIVGFGTIGYKYYLDNKKAKKAKEEAETITEDDISNMLEIKEFLEELIDKWRLDRGAIFQFHNGGKFFNGVSMKKFSMTYEVTAPGIAKILPPAKNSFVTEHPYLIKMMSENVIFSLEIEDSNLDYVRERLQEHGVLQLITIPVRSLNNDVLLGFVQFTMVRNKLRVSQEMEEDLIEAAQRISGYLHS